MNNMLIKARRLKLKDSSSSRLDRHPEVLSAPLCVNFLVQFSWSILRSIKQYNLYISTKRNHFANEELNDRLLYLLQYDGTWGQFDHSPDKLLKLLDLMRSKTWILSRSRNYFHPYSLQLVRLNCGNSSNETSIIEFLMRPRRCLGSLKKAWRKCCCLLIWDCLAIVKSVLGQS